MNDKDHILNDLSQPLDPSRVSKRTGAGSRQLSYLETYDVINHLNSIFGYDGWSDYLTGIERIGPTLWRATVRIEAHIGDTLVTHSDTGIGVHTKESNEEIEKAVKEAASDALKRAARKFGDQFGNCLYDKSAPEHNAGRPAPQQQRPPQQQQRPPQQRPQQAAPQHRSTPATQPPADAMQPEQWETIQRTAKSLWGDNWGSELNRHKKAITTNQFKDMSHAEAEQVLSKLRGFVDAQATAPVAADDDDSDPFGEGA
jgi:DNA recombination protein Rad52